MSRSTTLVAFALALIASGATTSFPGVASPMEPCKKPEVRVWKSRGVVELYCSSQLHRSFAATFGASPVGAKERDGDERTPEGRYQVTGRWISARFHRFIGISYPNEEDRRRARAKGIKRLGGGIGLHGTDARLAAAARVWTNLAHATGLHRVWGPTDGCIGMTNENVEVLFAVARIGTPVTISAE